jgi:hypothetical protein
MPVFDDVKNALRAVASVSRYYRRWKKLFIPSSP